MSAARAQSLEQLVEGVDCYSDTLYHSSPARYGQSQRRSALAPAAHTCQRTHVADIRALRMWVGRRDGFDQATGKHVLRTSHLAGCAH